MFYSIRKLAPIRIGPALEEGGEKEKPKPPTARKPPAVGHARFKIAQMLADRTPRSFKSLEEWRTRRILPCGALLPICKACHSAFRVVIADLRAGRKATTC